MGFPTQINQVAYTHIHARGGEWIMCRKRTAEVEEKTPEAIRKLTIKQREHVLKAESSVEINEICVQSKEKCVGLLNLTSN